MIKQTFTDICTDELMEGAIINDEFPGFKEDYLVLHCLLRKYVDPPLGYVSKAGGHNLIMEIGTNMGTGTNIICNARPDSNVYSLDLPTELAHVSLQHPINEGKGDRVGEYCTFPFTQLRGDSMTFDFSKYPAVAAFIDGEHDYDHPHREAKAMIANKTKLIVFHDANMEPVAKAIADAFKGNKDYQLYRVTDTRICYALKK